MIVNQIAKASGVEPHVVRYYARIGLLQPRRDTFNGYQIFTESDVVRLEFVRQAQNLGFSLKEISSLLDSAESGADGCCARMRSLLLRRIESNRRKLQELTLLQHRMEAAYAKWADVGGCAATAGGPCPRAGLMSEAGSP